MLSWFNFQKEGGEQEYFRYLESDGKIASDHLSWSYIRRPIYWELLLQTPVRELGNPGYIHDNILPWQREQRFISYTGIQKIMVYYEGEEKATRKRFFQERSKIREDWNRNKEEKRQKERERMRRNEALCKRKEEMERINREEQCKELGERNERERMRKRKREEEKKRIKWEEDIKEMWERYDEREE
jgi:hypothetical protein